MIDVCDDDNIVLPSSDSQKKPMDTLHLAVSFKAGVCVLIVTRIRRGDGLVVLALQPTGNVRCKVTAARGR